jgi:hypothetical protein
MFISDIEFKREFEPNEQVVLIKDYSCSFGLFTKGHKFTIVKNGDHGFTIIDDELGIEINDVSKIYLRCIIEPHDANKIANKRIRESKIKDMIKRRCTHKVIEYSDRNEYHVCKVREGYSRYNYGYCKPGVSCLQFFDSEIIEKYPILLGAVREEKLKKIKDKLSKD